MRTIGENKSRVSALTLPEIETRVRDVLHRMRGAGDGFRVNGRRPRDSHVLNAMILHFLSLPEAERDAAYIAAKAKLEALLAMEGEPTAEQADRVISGGDPAPAREGTPKTRVRKGPGSLPGKGHANGAG